MWSLCPKCHLCHYSHQKEVLVTKMGTWPISTLNHLVLQVSEVQCKTSELVKQECKAGRNQLSVGCALVAKLCGIWNAENSGHWYTEWSWQQVFHSYMQLLLPLGIIKLPGGFFLSEKVVECSQCVHRLWDEAAQGWLLLAEGFQASYWLSTHFNFLFYKTDISIASISLGLRINWDNECKVPGTK